MNIVMNVFVCVYCFLNKSRDNIISKYNPSNNFTGKISDNLAVATEFKLEILFGVFYTHFITILSVYTNS